MTRIAALIALMAAAGAAAAPAERITSRAGTGIPLPTAISRKLAVLTTAGVPVASLPEPAFRLTVAAAVSQRASLLFIDAARVDPLAGTATLDGAAQTITVTWPTRPGGVYLVDCEFGAATRRIDVVVGNAGQSEPVVDGRLLVVAAALPGTPTRRIVLLGEDGKTHEFRSCEITRAK